MDRSETILVIQAPKGEGAKGSNAGATMIVLHIAPIVWEKISGITVAVPGIVRSQNSLDDVNAALVVTSGQGLPSKDPGFPVFDYQARGARRGLKGLPHPFVEPDLVVFHTVYDLVSAKIASELHKAAIPYIITPHGGMTQAAQNIKWFKKRMGNLLFFNKLVRNAVAIHCTTEGEAQETISWDRPMFVVGYGTEVPPEEDVARPGRSNRLRFVFIGRLDLPHKGLDILLEACALSRSEILQEGAQVELFGPDHRGGRKILAKQIARRQLGNIVQLHPPVLGEAKKDLLKTCDVFVHTSRLEGHPVAVIEALSYGIPALLTPGTNMSSEVAASGAGWEVDTTPAGVAKGLQSILQLDRKQVQIAGEKARAWSLRQPTWQEVGRRCVTEYRRFLHARNRSTERKL